MKRRGGSLENMTVFYVILVVAIFNIIAYVSVRDWTAISFFVLAGLVIYAFDANKSITLILAIIASNLVRVTKVQREGMKKKDHIETKPDYTSHIKDLKEAMSGSNLEGLTQNTDKLVKQQQKMFHMAKNLGPMMKQATEMMKNLPEGFLEKAMNNLK